MAYYAQHNQCGCQKRLVSSWEDKRGKVMAPARSNSAIMHVQVQSASRWSTCARQLIIPFTYTINPSSLFKVHPTGKAHFGSFLLQSKVDGSMDVQMAYHISIWGCSESILLQVTNQSMHVRCCWVGRSWAFYLLVLLRPSCFVRVMQFNFPSRNCPHISVAKASHNLFLVEKFHDTIYRRVRVKLWILMICCLVLP